MKQSLAIILIYILYRIYKKNKKNNNEIPTTYIGKNLEIEQKIHQDIINKLSQIKEDDKEESINKISIDLSKYYSNGYLMTKTELLFYKELKKVTDKLNLVIFPQVNLERIINVYDSNYSDRNRIKSRSIDYTIANNKDCKIICCIELDDYYHNRESVKQKDAFKNELFKKVKIPLYRIKVNKFYNLEELENKIKKNLILQ